MNMKRFVPTCGLPLALLGLALGTFVYSARPLALSGAPVPLVMQVAEVEGSDAVRGPDRPRASIGVQAQVVDPTRGVAFRDAVQAGTPGVGFVEVAPGIGVLVEGADGRAANGTNAETGSGVGFGADRELGPEEAPGPLRVVVADLGR